MMDNVHNIGGIGGNISSNKLKKAYQMPESKPGADAVNLSSEVMNLKGVDGIRMDKVMEVKRAIADGTYLTAEKLGKALDKAIEDATRSE